MTIEPEVLPPRSETGVTGWLKANLFGTPLNSVITVLVGGLAFAAIYGIGSWTLFEADWSAIDQNVKLFLVGQYPTEELWRIGVVMVGLAFMMGVSWAVWGDTLRTFARIVAAAAGIIAIAPMDPAGFDLPVRVWYGAGGVSVLIGFWTARSLRPAPKWVIRGWVAGFLVALAVIWGVGDSGPLPRVSTGVWGGLLLTFALALAGIVASFPFGVLLALGRRSSLPVVKWMSVAFIELIRGVPLITLLFMTLIIVPLLLPEGTQFDRVLRAFVAITVFSAAYMAENVRGGLQAVPIGQVEGAKALGLGGIPTMAFVVLPQALRAVIPAIVGQFISLFKDTSLVVTVGLLDILGISKSIVLGNVKWIGAQAEVFLFVGVVFWVFTFSMAYASRKLEKSLGVGER
jgi:general L-amino acid transport system permease protein